MNEHKKAGFIVGGFIIVVAIIILIIVSGKSNKKEKPNNLDTTVNASTTSVQVQEQPQPMQTQAQQQIAEPTKNSSIIEIDLETLPQPLITDEIGVVQTKALVLIDGELYYSLNMLVGSDNKQLKYIVSATGFKSVEVGTKCKVELACYTVANGSVYYLINSMATLD